MDPSTGTFTTMDTYAGSLSDPMSLHKYMFANSNPVMYCDPSGHITLGEECVVMGCIGAICGAIYYTIDTLVNDPGMENHSYIEFVETILLFAVIAIAIVLLIHFIEFLWGLILGLLVRYGPVILQWIDDVFNKKPKELKFTGETYGPFREVQNANGGTVWVSDMRVGWEDVVALYEKLGKNINIVTGIDGNDCGQYVLNPDFTLDDMEYLVGVYRIWDYSTWHFSTLVKLVNSEEVTVLAWCFSELSKLASKIVC